MLYKVAISSTIGKLVYSGSMFDPEHDKILNSYGVKFHHSAKERGYISRKGYYCEIYEYEGKFGDGLIEFSAMYDSSVYCYKTYYIKEEQLMKFATIKTANEVIKETKENATTSYFGWEMFGKTTYCSMSDMVRNFRDAGFGVAESNFIVAAMIKAGAKFTI